MKKVILTFSFLLVSVCAGAAEVKLLFNKSYYPVVLGAIENAKTSIRILQFSFAPSKGEIDQLIAAVIARKDLVPGLDVKVFLEGDKDGVAPRNRETMKRLEAAKISVFVDSTNRTTHAKGISIDDETVFVGSHNLTKTSVTLNNEGTARITSKPIAAAFNNYFERLVQKSEDLQQVRVRDDNVEILTDDQFYDEILRVINGAKKTIDLATYFLAYRGKGDGKIQAILDALIEAKKREVKIRLFLEQSEDYAPHVTAANRTAAAYLKAGGVETFFDRPKQISHGKYIVVDGEEVLMGTANLYEKDLFDFHQINLILRDRALAKAVSHYHTARVAFDSVEPPGAQDPYIRFWVGTGNQNLNQTQFLEELDLRIIRRTAAVGEGKGLIGYTPVVLSKPENPEAKATEVAMVIYRNQYQYGYIFETDAGQVYRADHGVVFDLEKSGSVVPVRYLGSTKIGAAYLATSPEPTSWQGRAIRFRHFSRPSALTDIQWEQAAKIYADQGLLALQHGPKGREGGLEKFTFLLRSGELYVYEFCRFRAAYVPNESLGIATTDFWLEEFGQGVGQPIGFGRGVSMNLDPEPDVEAQNCAGVL